MAYTTVKVSNSVIAYLFSGGSNNAVLAYATGCPLQLDLRYYSSQTLNTGICLYAEILRICKYWRFN